MFFVMVKGTLFGFFIGLILNGLIKSKKKNENSSESEDVENRKN